MKKSKKKSNTICPECYIDINCSFGFGLPKPGDLTICAYCQSVLKFTDTMSLEMYKTFDQLDEEEKQTLLETINLMQQIMNRENN